jgi:hypothetical protein
MSSDITEFIGVYDADATVLGEISYWIGARLGKRHCSLCDITHGLFSERNDWKQCRGSLTVPFVTFHRNDAPHEVLAVANGVFPAVFARSQEQISRVLGPADLEALNGSPKVLVNRLNELHS